MKTEKRDLQKVANEQKKRELLALEEKVKDSDHSLAELKEVWFNLAMAFIMFSFIACFKPKSLVILFYVLHTQVRVYHYRVSVYYIHYFQQVQVMESSKTRLDLEATKLERDLDERIERNAKANDDMCASTPIFHIFVYDSFSVWQCPNTVRKEYFLNSFEPF